MYSTKKRLTGVIAMLLGLALVGAACGDDSGSASDNTTTTAAVGGATVAGVATTKAPDVTGTLTMSGTQITAVQVNADLTSLKSDDNRRDGQLQRQALETARFPQATFKLTSPIELGATPVEGKTITATATGELTLHGVTKTVQVPIEARLSGDVVTVVGSLEIQFADYSVDQPTSFAVLSIEDHGTMEFQLHFRHQ